MTNSRRGSASYNPRHTDEEAYELLPPAIRAAMRNAAFEWSANSILARYKKALKKWGPQTSERSVIATIRDWDQYEIARGWKLSPKVGVRNAPSPSVACKVPVLYTGDRA